jgi:hypothetical protein
MHAQGQPQLCQPERLDATAASHGRPARRLARDVKLLALDHLRELIRDALGGAEARLNASQLDDLCQALHHLAQTPSAQQTLSKRPVMRAMLEINTPIGSQFSPIGSKYSTARCKPAQIWRCHKCPKH